MGARRLTGLALGGPVRRTAWLLLALAIAWAAWYFAPDRPLRRWVFDTPASQNCAISADGRRLAVEHMQPVEVEPGAWTHATTRIAVYDLETGAELLSIPRTPSVTASHVAIAPDGSWLLTADPARDLGGTELWDINTGTLRARLRHPHQMNVESLVSPDGRLIVSRHDKRPALV